MQSVIQYTENDNFMFDSLSILTGLTFEQVKEVFEYLLVLQFTQYMEEKPIAVPYLGTIAVEYEKDEILRGHKRAVLKTNFKDSELLKRIVGEIEDGSNESILGIIKNFVENRLLYLLNEETQNGTGNQARKQRRKEPSFSGGFSKTKIETDTDID